MTFEMILGVIGVFILLAITHYLALKIGWDMGIKRDPSVPLSKPKTQATTHEEYVDPYDKERLDFE